MPLVIPLNLRRFRFNSGPLFRRLLKTQPGVSAWIAFGFGIAIGEAVEGHYGDLTLLLLVTSVCATFEIG